MSEQIEDLESFRLRARAWISGNLQRVEHQMMTLRPRPDEEELAGVARDREVQRMLFDAGLAGICVPREYGGQGLTQAHQHALNKELVGFEYPMRLQVPTMTPCSAVLQEFGTEEQKKRHLPAILKGEEIWMQFLSEPSGGSDVAGALTSATREGDDWVLNGSKIWTTGAWWSDYGLVLARTNWDVPKHRGLTVFILPIRSPGVTVSRIEMLNGNREFCQEFLTDVRIPDSARVGAIDDGWTVGTRWMFHERLQHNSPFVTYPNSGGHGSQRKPVLGLAREAGRGDDPVARDLVGKSLTLNFVLEALNRRLGEGMATGVMSDQSAAVGRVFSAHVAERSSSLAFEIADGAGGAWADSGGQLADAGTDYLMRQQGSIGGGTTEMARNVVAERVLGMPRERSIDTSVPFREVPRGATR